MLAVEPQASEAMDQRSPGVHRKPDGHRHSNGGPVSERRLRVALVYGGRSAEHDVSRVSAVAVGRAFDPARYEVIPIAITTDGRWLVSVAARVALESGAAALPV